MPEPTKLIGIILVMFRQKHNLDLLYRSLLGQSEKNFRIYFVDNNSDSIDADLSRKLNEELKLDLVYITPGSNTGFAGGNNIGACKAISDGCEYIFFLNNDTVLDSSCLLHLRLAIDTHPGTGAAAPLIITGLPGEESNYIIQEFGASANFKTYDIHKYYEKQKYIEVEDRLPQVFEVDLISGGAAFFKTAVLLETGLWNEMYFAYGDEIDLAGRVLKAGFKTIAVKNAVLWHNHKWNKNNKQGYYFEYYLIQRNKYLYFRQFKFYGEMFIALFKDILMFPWRIIWFIKVCDFSLGLYYLRGTFAGLLGKSGKPKFNFLK